MWLGCSPCYQFTDELLLLTQKQTKKVKNFAAMKNTLLANNSLQNATISHGYKLLL